MLLKSFLTAIRSGSLCQDFNGHQLHAGFFSLESGLVMGMEMTCYC